MTTPIYKMCLMCRMVDLGNVKVNEEAYYKAGGRPEEVSHGICKDQECRLAYVMYLSGGDSCGIQHAMKELEELEKLIIDEKD